MSPSSSFGDDGVPGLQVDEEVALEEDARADLGRRRPRGSAAPVFLISSVTTASSVPSCASTFLTLPTVDAGDPHGRVRPQRVGRLERRLDAEAVRERDVLREAEERRRRTMIAERDQPDRERAAAARGGAGGRRPLACVPSVLACCLPATLPITLRPTAERLVAGLALLRLAGRRRVRVRVRVQVVVGRSGRWRAPRTGRPRCSGPAAWR